MILNINMNLTRKTSHKVIVLGLKGFYHLIEPKARETLYLGHGLGYLITNGLKEV